MQVAMNDNNMDVRLEVMPMPKIWSGSRWNILLFAPTNPGVNLPLPFNDIRRNGITLLRSYGNSSLVAQLAIDLLDGCLLPVHDIVTHRLSMAEAGLGFQLVAEARECIKVILQPHK
jgi:threonine dehydrogenase-like Zn-dependent dehydrogenase